MHSVFTPSGQKCVESTFSLVVQSMILLKCYLIFYHFIAFLVSHLSSFTNLGSLPNVSHSY